MIDARRQSIAIVRKVSALVVCRSFVLIALTSIDCWLAKVAFFLSFFSFFTTKATSIFEGRFIRIFATNATAGLYLQPDTRLELC
jgi:hypothetical protein